MKTTHILLVAALLAASSASAAINIETVLVGDAGNPADTTGYGAVSYGYYIGTYEVTNAQYAEFLNAKAASDPNGLYSTSMAPFGITRSGTYGSYTYAVNEGFGDKPVNYVSFWDAARFTNWLTNGQGNGDTETGVYVLTPTGISNNTVVRDATAWNAGGVAVASEDEWYKAAYYSGSPTGADGDGYWLYPTQSNTVPTATAPNGSDSNSANYDSAVGNVTDVGGYSAASGYYGTFDQGGNLFEWTEAIVYTSDRVSRGGALNVGENFLSSSLRSSGLADGGPVGGTINHGFRVTSLEPIGVTPFEPELELQVSTDGLSTWETIQVTPEMLTPEGKIQPGATGTGSAFYRMIIKEAP